MMKIYSLLFLAIFLLVSCDNTTSGGQGNKDNPCDSIVCGEHGTCKASDDNLYGYCICQSGYTYDANANPACVNPCKEEQCSPNGICIPNGSTAVCNCDDGYYFVKTDDTIKCVKMGDPCKDVECQGGTCNPTTAKCECPGGFHLVDDIKCEINEGCNSPEVNCGEHGECVEDIEGDWWCECSNGYYNNGTTCVRELCVNGIECGTTCCNGSQICMNGNRCVLPGNDCESDFECDVNYFCDSILGKCMEIGEDADTSCRYFPEFQQDMNPMVAWSWDGTQTTSYANFKNVLMPPVVANINDDNNDGYVNLKDTPDVVFSSYPDDKWDTEAVLRVVSGNDGSEIFTITDPMVSGGSGMAVGDIDNDGFNEILAIKVGNKRVVAFNHDGTLKWTQNADMPRTAPGAMAIADIDHDGNPEVLIGNYIINGQTGVEKCHSTDSLGSYGNNSDHPTAAHKRYITAVEDINNDGFMDIVTGNLIISGRDCSTIWSRTDRKDGYTAIADINFNGKPEIIAVSNGYLYIYDAFTGADLVTPFEIDNSFQEGTITRYPIGGAPTVANFDNDPTTLEIAIAGADSYKVLKPNLSAQLITTLWEKETKDRSSRQTGSSLFDFEGDGRAEVLYADECYFRIYDGYTGRERFKIKNSSATIFEYPLVVDVDADGKSEIVVVANASYATNVCPWGNHKDDGNYGVRVFEDGKNNWVRTRMIWNQHSYHITNVTESGKIPQIEQKNYETYNNYRLNSQGEGVFNAPNFVVEKVTVKRTDCPVLKFKIQMRIANLGSISIPAGVPVAIYKGYMDGEGNPVSQEVLGVAFTQTDLWPGRRETVEFDFIPPANDEARQYNIYVSADDFGNGIGTYTECNERDNIMETSFKGQYTLFCKDGIGQCMRFSKYRCDDNNNLSCFVTTGTPVTEVCNDGLDNNCDGETDENCGCNSSATQECYSGYAQSFDVNSKCKKGTQTCIGGEYWTECKDDILPTPEVCNNVDDDCNGTIDDGFGVGQTCNVGLGICRRNGTFQCDETGNAVCNAIMGEPVLEICGNNLDDDCDGSTDERPCVE